MVQHTVLEFDCSRQHEESYRGVRREFTEAEVAALEARLKVEEELKAAEVAEEVKRQDALSVLANSHPEVHEALKALKLI